MPLMMGRALLMMLDKLNLQREMLVVLPMLQQRH
jgi:hypothetical protein